MTPKKDIFYFQGEYFDTFEKLIKYEQKWRRLPLDEETADRIFNRVKNDIIMNVFLFDRQLTNAEFSKIIEEIFMFAMEKMREKE